MTLTQFLPAVLPAKPDLGASARWADASQRAGRALACGVLLSSTLVAGWMPPVQAAKPRTPAAKTPPLAEADDGSAQSYEVFGKRYRVRTSSDGYSERGVASWYGHPFDGRPTSSGEMYDMEGMTAAHRSLPIPTWVEVTNLGNGKRVVVKVNDRGPFVGKRVIDLSYAAARALDMVQTGTARVEVRALPGPPPKSATARRSDRDRTKSSPATPPPRPTKALPDAAPQVAASPPSHTDKPPSPRKQTRKPAESREPAAPGTTGGDRLFAEAGKFRTRDDAVHVVADLKAQGFVNAFVVTEDGRRKSSHRVRVGPLHDEAEVDNMNDRLRDLGAKRSHSVTMR
ncbi:MAG TPA: septal ring lytic transglycosylase RlpA family protein [Gammaproteobacteria bacterium]|nr:septal ring lytic transglycosylase RlpA family protein [Gammaproteobacteria bacterium]